ncbi:MAG TPA: class I SAM-dependent methyltransferase, partial [Candidatus Binatia bacterium]|nr:class I SAM-dependent methyltransferase [Candidatus Binatia bacterium]
MNAGLNRLLNRVRKIKRKWTRQKDRDFHDRLFEGPQPQPFTFSYYGYTTIKRFADLAAPHVEKAAAVLDLGCGPAEITCELASRFPHISFLGVDHSLNAIARAKTNARTLGLKNIEFQAAAMEEYQADRKFDLVLMFDSFHHLSAPRRFVERLGEHAGRFLLIEPRGDWKGSHVRDLDFDWIVRDLETMRRRLAMKIGEAAAAVIVPGRGEMDPGAAALENRYSLEEFKSFFKGFGLRVRGTVSGLESYPPDPFLQSASREIFGKTAYEIFRAIDDLLKNNELDLLAKHWVIEAARELESRDIRIPAIPYATEADERLQGPYDVDFADYDGPRSVAPASEFRAQVRFHNRSFRPLSSFTVNNPDLLSYHWLDRRGAIIQSDGLRTP